MKIVLISTYLEIYSIGLRIISALLKKEGFQVNLLFLPQDFRTPLTPGNIEEIADFSKDADLIGLSLMSNQFPRSIEITKALRPKTKAPIVWGGIHPTTCPESCLEHADAVCIGEGEETFVDLARRLRDNPADIYTTPSLWFKKNGAFIKNPIRPLISDLDSLPYPDYAYEEQYLLDDGRIRVFNETYFKKHLSTIYLTLSSRGCPYSCSYCCNNAIKQIYHRQKSPLYRRRSLTHLMGELAWVKANIPFIKRILFEDDLFLATSDENIEQFCNVYKKEISLPFTVAGITPTTINEKRLRVLLDAGMCYVRMGIQTASRQTARLFNRNMDMERTFETIQLFNRYKKAIKHPYYDFILDTPWESIDDKMETLRYLARIPHPYKLNLFSMTFYPGTELYEKARKDGLITDDFRQIYEKNYTFLEHTYANALFYILYCNAWLPLRLKHALINKKLILFFDKHKLFGRIAFLLAKSQYLCIEGIKDILSGKMWRIIKFFQLRKLGGIFGYK